MRSTHVGCASDELAQLVAAKFWERQDVIEKSGSAFMPGNKEADPDVARACAQILLKAASSKSVSHET